MHKAQASPLFTVCSYVIKDVFNILTTSPLSHQLKHRGKWLRGLPQLHGELHTTRWGERATLRGRELSYRTPFCNWHLLQGGELSKEWKMNYCPFPGLPALPCHTGHAGLTTQFAESSGMWHCFSSNRKILNLFSFMLLNLPTALRERSRACRWDIFSRNVLKN